MASKDVILPDIGEGVTEGEMVKWLVKVGDSVAVDQAVAEIMTDKATVEVPSPTSGVVKELKPKEGDTVLVGDVLCVLEETAASAAKTSDVASSPVSSVATAPAVSTAAAPAPMAASGVGSAGYERVEEIRPPVAQSHVLASPSTRRYARELNVDINTIRGTGNAGRVTREDVGRGQSGLGAVSAGQPSYQPNIPKLAYQAPVGALEERVPLKGIRKKIAENLQMAKHIVPHFTLMEEANVTELFNLRGKLKGQLEERGVKVTYLPFVMKALIATIREFPMFNASIDDQAQEIVYKKYMNLGFAADTPNGLLVPVIKHADQKTIIELSQEITELAKKGRDGKLSLDEMRGASITVTNIGSVGGVYATPIINHPEVAILGMYKVSEKPIILDGQLAAIKVMNFTITCDHRLIDGAVAARFMKSFVGRIENPGLLMMEMV
jgi:pyruvate dehydrogenase E2 component (dihydrolipoamide acetyltransferase)